MAMAENVIATDGLCSSLQYFWLFEILLSMIFTPVISPDNLRRVIMRAKKPTK
jgi:hypothetical protein